MACPGDKALTCGGYLTMNIYGTGDLLPSQHITPIILSGLVPLVPSKIGLSGGDIDKPVKIVYLLTIAGRASRQVSILLQFSNISLVDFRSGGLSNKFTVLITTS